jgi:hypothetical protein
MLKQKALSTSCTAGVEQSSVYLILLWWLCSSGEYNVKVETVQREARPGDVPEPHGRPPAGAVCLSD